MESPKMYSSSRCKKRTYLCGSANDPISCKAVQGRERKFAEVRVFPFLWYRVFALKQSLYEKEATSMESTKCIPLVGAKTALTSAGLQTTPSHVSQYRAENGKLRKSGSTFRHGTIIAPNQCLYQKEATSIASPKMYSCSRCKSRTYLCGTANNPVSYKPEQCRERKFTEIRVYLLPWYHVCTKAMFILKESYGYGESKNVFVSLMQKPHLPVWDCKRLRLM